MALSSVRVLRSYDRMVFMSASEMDFQTLAIDSPAMRSITMWTVLLWTKAQCTRGTGIEVLAATKTIVAAYVK